MWYEKLLSAILQRGYSNDWPGKFEAGFNALFGSEGGRYPESARRLVRLRNPEPSEGKEGIVPFAALIHPSNPDSGPYGGTSLAVFPGEDAPCLISLVVGTNTTLSKLEFW
jgi:5-methylcytosine-specific restriction protein B